MAEDGHKREPETPGTAASEKDSDKAAIRVRVNGSWYGAYVQDYKGQNGVWVPVYLDLSKLKANGENNFHFSSNVLCSPHQIHNVQVEEILLRQLKSITAYARSHETEFVELVTKQNEKELNRLMRNSNKELVQAKERIKKLDSIMQRLYEDNIDGKISDDRFSRMSATYETEQKQLDARASEPEAAIAEAREQRLNADSFLGMVRRYTDITELTAEIIRSFVEKIEVKKPEKVPGTRTKKQALVIWWNFIGVVDIPQQEQKETA